MKTNHKKVKTIFFIFSLLSFLGMGVSLICDLAMNQEITWALYPLIAIPFAWMAIAPLFLVKKHKILYSLIILSIVVFPFLYFLQFVTPVHGWFIPLALPITIVGVGLLWITYLLLKFLKVSIWYLGAILMFLYGVIGNAIIQYFAAKFTNDNFISVDLVINTVATVAISILLIIIGYKKNKDEKL